MSADIKNNPCQICGNKAYKGFHFQVDCCRACAAFYRRTIEAGKSYKCKYGNKDCKLKAKIKGVPLCRYCRFQRCKELGMRQQRANSSTTSETPTLDDECPNISQKIAFTRFRKSHDVKSEKFHEILASPFPFLIIQLKHPTFLQSLEYGFSQFHEKVKPKAAIVVLSRVDSEEMDIAFSRYKNEIAKVLMHCKEYAELDFEEKILLHKNATHLFANFERFYTSIKYGCHENDKYCMIMYENVAVELNKPTNIYQIKEYEKIAPSWQIYCEKMIKVLYKPIIELKLTQFEIVYLLAQILWSTQEIKGLKSSTHDIANNMTDRIATELHNYYVNEEKMENYSPRLIKMLKLIDGSKLILSELQNLTLIIQTSNIINFNADLSELCDRF